MKFRVTCLLAASIFMGVYANAQAHTGFVVNSASVPFANKTYFATMNASHGCEDAVTGVHYDTEVLEIDVPDSVTSVRPLDATWGDAEVVTDPVSGAVTMLRWTRTNAAHDTDTYLYRASFSVRLPNASFTSIAFPTRQICNGGTLTTPWEGAESPTLNLVPARSPGWNKFTAQADIDAAGLNTFFSDALIVWYNNAAFSANAVTASLITNALTTIPAGSEFWVKY